MKSNWHELVQDYISGTITDVEALSLEQQLRTDPLLRDWYLDALNLDSALEATAESAQTALSLPVPFAQQALLPATAASSRWFAWRPFTAAAAGLVFGMLCTSVVFGFVNQRVLANKITLSVFDAGLEDENQVLGDGLPGNAGQWGMDAARLVTAEGSVRPLQGERMMRLEPIPRNKSVKNHTSRVYQVLDLRLMSALVNGGDSEAEVSASFCAQNGHVRSRYLIRAIALDEAPEMATKNFWSKVESDGVVSESQRFDTLPDDAGWHTFSMKLRLPPESKTLVLIIGAVPPESDALPDSVHYLDEVQVTLITPQPLP